MEVGINHHGANGAINLTIINQAINLTSIKQDTSLTGTRVGINLTAINSGGRAGDSRYPILGVYFSKNLMVFEKT